MIILIQQSSLQSEIIKSQNQIFIYDILFLQFIKSHFIEFYIRIFGSITLTSKTNYATVSSYKLNDDIEGLLSSFIRILTNSIQLLHIDIYSIQANNHTQQKWLQVLTSTVNNQSCSIGDLRRIFYKQFVQTSFSKYIQQFIQSLPEELQNIFTSTYFCQKCNKKYKLFSSQSQESCEQCNSNLLLQHPASIKIQFLDKYQHILRKTMIEEEDYVLYCTLSCKKEDTLKFFQILVDFNYIQQDQLYILNIPQNCQMAKTIDPLTYLKSDKVLKYLQNQGDNSIKKRIGSPQLVMYFNAKDLQGKARQNVAEQYDIQQSIKQSIKPAVVQQSLTLQPIQSKQLDSEIKPQPLVEQEEILIPQQQQDHIHILIWVFYIVSLIFWFISLVLLSKAIGKVSNNYQPNGLIIKNNLIFEDKSQSNVINTNISNNQQIQQLKAQKQILNKTFQISYYTIQNTVLNNSLIENYIGEQQQCYDAQLSSQNINNVKSIRLETSNLNISNLQAQTSIIKKINTGYIEQLEAQNVNSTVLNTTQFDFINSTMQNRFQKIETSTLQSGDLTCTQFNASGTTQANNSYMNNVNNINLAINYLQLRQNFNINGQLNGNTIKSNDAYIRNCTFFNPNIIFQDGNINDGSITTTTTNLISDGMLQNVNSNNNNFINSFITNLIQNQDLIVNSKLDINNLTLTKIDFNSNIQDNEFNIINLTVQEKINDEVITTQQQDHKIIIESNDPQISKINIGNNIDLNYEKYGEENILNIEDNINLQVPKLILDGLVNSSNVNIADNVQNLQNLIVNTKLNSNNTNTTSTNCNVVKINESLQINGTSNIDITEAEKYYITDIPFIEYDNNNNKILITPTVINADEYTIADGNISLCE